MVVKPAVAFTTADNDAQLIIDTNVILTALTNNPNYTKPAPTLAVVTTALNAFSTALAAAADGGITLTAVKNDRRVDLVLLLRQLASYVQVACDGDMTKLLSSGFPVQKPQRQPVGVLPAPVNLDVSLGARSGELVSKAEPVPGAAIYNWRVTTAAAPTTPVQTAQTTGARTTFSALTPGVVYNVEANAVGSAGPSDWSEPASHMAL